MMPSTKSSIQVLAGVSGVLSIRLISGEMISEKTGADDNRGAVKWLPGRRGVMEGTKEELRKEAEGEVMGQTVSVTRRCFSKHPRVCRACCFSVANFFLQWGQR